MAFNSSTKRVATKRLVRVLETKASSRIMIDDENSILNPLEAFGQVQIVSEDKIGENYQFSGSVEVTAVYVDKNKEIKSVQANLDFNERVSIGEVDGVFLVPTLKNVKLNKESERQMIVTASVEIKIYGVICQDFIAVEGEQEGFFTTTKNVYINNLIATSNTSFSISDKLNVTDGKVLGLWATIGVSKVTPFDNYLTIEGTAIIDAIVANNETIKKEQQLIDFIQEVSALNLTQDSIVDLNLYCKSLNVIDGSLDAEGLILDLNIGVGVWGFERKEITLITDAFSNQKQVDLTFASFENSANKVFKSLSERKTLVKEVADKKRMDEILFVGDANVKVSEVNPLDGEVLVAGSIVVPVVFKNYDNDEVSSSFYEMEYEVKAPLDAVDLNLSVDTEINARVNSYKNKAGKEISFVVDFEIMISGICGEEEQYISKIEETGSLPQSKSSIIVYKPKVNETIFEIAKSLKVSPDVILAQNPSIDESGVIGQVVVYKKK